MVKPELAPRRAANQDQLGAQSRSGCEPAWRKKPGQWIFIWTFAGYSNVVGEGLAEGCLSTSLAIFVSKWLDTVGGGLPSNTAGVSVLDFDSNPQGYRALCRKSKDLAPLPRGCDHQLKGTNVNESQVKGPRSLP
jgi:hypothetical protein